MKKWELVRYLIDSKKIIDSLDYISENHNKISNLDLYSLIYEKQLHFFVTMCIFLDNCYSKKDIKQLKNNDKIIKDIYYHRNKNYAHKDQDYLKAEFNNLDELVLNNKTALDHVFKISTQYLPKDLTLEYVCHDKNLYRLVNNITPLIEDKFREMMYPEQKDLAATMIGEYKVLNDTEDYKYIASPEEYAVIMECGLNAYEFLQNFQDSMIKFNVLHDQNVWVFFNDSVAKNKLEYINESLLNIVEDLKNVENQNNIEDDK